MSLAMICRGDDGGLGVVTFEAARHLQPGRVLVVDVDPPRGVFRPERYDALGVEYRVTPNPINAADLAWLRDGATTLFTFETFYLDDALPPHGVDRLVFLANPELFRPQYRSLADRGVIDVYAPTAWATERLGKHRLLPVPVALDRFDFAVRSGVARTFLHVSAPAMLDRNGTELVRQACGVYDGEPVDLLVSGPEAPGEPTQIGNVRVYPVPHADNYWQRWSTDVDVFIQPRRYGGLSMVQAEAAAAGVPTICLDRFPERTWGGALVVPTNGQSMARMKGGDFAVRGADPAEVADAMSWCSTLGDLTELSGDARRWAESLGWSSLLPEWQTALS